MRYIEIIDKEKCVGCTACSIGCPQQCIKMEKDRNGFRYPSFHSAIACIECGYCEKVCPILKKKQEEIKSPVVYAALSKNEGLRMESSSGGVFSELAKAMISQGGVVYGAAYDEQFEVRHCCVDSVDNLWKLRGAKYAESDLGDSFLQIRNRLDRGQKVLFTGTSCQVAGLKSYVKKNDTNLFCIDFVCHGVPSPMVWKEYVLYRSRKDNEGELPININLRSKYTGWSKYQYSNVFEYKNGKKYSALSADSLFMKLFVGDYISRESCGNCKFKGYSRVSDITLGDFWGIWDVDPQMDDDKGTSVVLIQSEKGQFLWNTISHQIVHKEVSLEQASEQNFSMLVSSKANAERNEVLYKIRVGSIGECEKLFLKRKKSFLDRIKAKCHFWLN